MSDISLAKAASQWRSKLTKEKLCESGPWGGIHQAKITNKFWRKKILREKRMHEAKTVLKISKLAVPAAAKTSAVIKKMRISKGITNRRR